jgi:hypothetical protein
MSLLEYKKATALAVAAFFVQKSGGIQESIQSGAKNHPETLAFSG